MKKFGCLSLLLVLVSCGATPSTNSTTDGKVSSYEDVSKPEKDVTYNYDDFNLEGKEKYKYFDNVYSNNFKIVGNIDVDVEYGNNFVFGIGAENQNFQFEFRYESIADTFSSIGKKYDKTNQATELGRRYSISAINNLETELMLIKYNNEFYMFVDGSLVQSRTFVSNEMTPYVYIDNTKGNFENFQCTTTNISSVLDTCVDEARPFSHNYMTSNYSAYSGDFSSFDIDEDVTRRTIDYALVGFEGEYLSQEIDITFKSQNLKFNKALVDTNKIFPKFGIISYHDLGYADYICFSPAYLRVETRVSNGFTQWMNHTPLGEANSLDITKPISYRIHVSNYKSSQVYRFYVNDILAGMRVATGYSEIMKFGFGAEHVCGNIYDLKIVEGGE